MKILNTIVGLMMAASLVANVLLWIEAKKPAEVRVETRTEYVTIRDSMPKAKESHLTGETIKVTAKVKHEADALSTVADEHRHAKNHEPDVPTKELMPEVCISGDSATVMLPVMQVVYEDSLYTAYISGYRPRLDSITLRIPHTITTVTKTIGKPARRLAVGPTVGAGYGIVGKQLDVFVGVSVTWNVWP